MARALMLLALAVLAGCGGSEQDAADINRANDAEEVVYLQRVLGDDPVSESVSLREDGTVAVRRGGGRGFSDLVIELTPEETEAALAHVRSAPFARLDGSTVTPGGFGGDDNDRRYLIRHGTTSFAVTEADVPKAMRPMIRDLNALIDGDLGTVVADDRHYSAVGVTGSSDDDADAPVIENSPATPVEGGDAPEPERRLSCYGSGTRSAGPADGLRVGPLTLRDDAVVLEPGGSATLVARRPVLRFGGGRYRIVRFEGCSDSTTGGGATRFEGTVAGCARVTIHAGGDVVRRRIDCGR